MITPRTEHDFWIGEPMDLEFTDLRIRRGGAYLNSLTLAYQFYEVAAADANKPGDVMAGLTGAVTWLSTDGDYYGQIPQSSALDAALAADTTYFVHLSGSSGATAVSRWLKVRAQYRAEA